MTFVPNLSNGVERLVFVPTLCSMNNMSIPHQPFVQYVTAAVLASVDTRCDGCDGHDNLRGYRMMGTPHPFEFLCSDCRSRGLRPPADEYFTTFDVDVVLGITTLPEGDPYS